MGTTGRAVLGLEDATYTDADLDLCGRCASGVHSRHRAMLAGACRVCDCPHRED